MSKYHRNPVGLCKICNKNKASQFHHRFPQTKDNLKNYGKMIHYEFNIVDSCDECNVSHKNIPPEFKWTEKQFRKEASGFALPPPLKSYK